MQLLFCPVGCKNFLHFSRMIPPIGFTYNHITVSFASISPAIQACTCFHTLQIPHFSSYMLLQSCFDAVIAWDEFNTICPSPNMKNSLACSYPSCSCLSSTRCVTRTLCYILEDKINRRQNNFYGKILQSHLDCVVTIASNKRNFVW